MKLRCGKSKCCEHEVAGGSPAGGAMFPLAFAGEGEQVEVVAVCKSKKVHERLLSMGIGIGDTLDIIKCQGRGAVLVAKGRNRYALGGGMAQKIYVRPLVFE
jgi:Fe2+ transport system protein FeoA